MRQLRALFIRLAELFRKPRREQELAAEMESHLQLHIEDNLRSGMTPQEAHRQALIRLGGLEQTKESYRDRRSLPLLETSVRDLRFAARMLRKNVGFTVVVVFTLTLGIGANTAIFSVLESQLWRPLPFPDSERLVDVHTVLRKNPRQWDVITNSVYHAWAEQTHVCSSLGAYNFPAARPNACASCRSRLRYSKRWMLRPNEVAFFCLTKRLPAVITSPFSVTRFGRTAFLPTRTSSASRSPSTAIPTPSWGLRRPGFSLSFCRTPRSMSRLPSIPLRKSNVAFMRSAGLARERPSKQRVLNSTAFSSGGFSPKV